MGVRVAPGFSARVCGPEFQPGSVLMLLAWPLTRAFLLPSPHCPRCSREGALHWGAWAACPAGLRWVWPGLRWAGMRRRLCPHRGSFSGNVVPASLFLAARAMAWPLVTGTRLSGLLTGRPCFGVLVPLCFSSLIDSCFCFLSREGLFL